MATYGRSATGWAGAFSGSNRTEKPLKPRGWQRDARAGARTKRGGLGEGHLSVHLRCLGDLAGALEHADEIVERFAKELHPLGLRAQLEEALLGEDRQLHARRDRVRVAVLQAVDLGLGA